LLGLLAVGGGVALACAARPWRGPVQSPMWPSGEARLVSTAPRFPSGFGRRRVFVDAGHGAPGNPGNVSCFCVDEQDFTRGAARALGERLAGTGHFEVRLSREGDRLVDYHARVDEAERWGAQVFISLHSDVRGKGEPWSPRPGLSCLRSVVAPGFSVLWSDEGDAGLLMARRALSRAVARRMTEAGFLAYGAPMALYERDAEVAGVFVDRHAPDQRIFVLRKPSMPSILIETHHALDPREAARWEEAETQDAFAAAVAQAIVELFSGAASSG